MISLPVLSIILLMAAAGPARAEQMQWLRSEDAVVQAQQAVISPWAKAWKKGDAPAFAALFSDPARLPDLDGKKTLRRSVDGISEFDWAAAPSADKGRAAWLKETSAYLGSFKSVEDLDLRVVDATLSKDGSDASLKTRFDLRAYAKDGGLRTDRGMLSVHAVLSAGKWKIAGIERVSMETLTSREAVFEDATAKTGLDSVPVYARTEAIRRGGYAVAVGDYDGDGKPDLYVGESGPGRLYHNRGDGTYEDVTEKSGLGKDTYVKSALWADMDNDGRMDLVLLRFVDDESQDMVFYKNLGGGKFKRVDATMVRKNKHDRPMIMTAADFNGDGYLDLYVGYPGVRDFTDSAFDAKSGLVSQAVYINRGNWRFEEQVDDKQSPAFTEMMRPHSAMGIDLDGDGRSDIIIVDDRGEVSRAYQQNKSGGFSSVEGRANLHNQGWGMVAIGGDFQGLGRDGVYFSNVDFTPGGRMLSLIEQSGETASVPGYARLKGILGGNRLFAPSADHGFTEVTQRAGVGWAGEAPAGAVWVDYNNDGLLDLYVTNGLWSADPDRDYTEQFIRDQLLKDPAKDQGDPSGKPNKVMAALQQTGESFGGYQRNRLFRNNGDGTFTEVGFVTGADRGEDGYEAAVVDYDRDGRADIILRNADPSSLKYSHRAVTVLHNKSSNPNRSLVVYLKGDEGGSGAIGARVVIKYGGKTESSEIRAVEGAVQNETAAFFGVGDAQQIESLEVHWPTGSVDRFQGVKPGSILVREGESRLIYLSSLPKPVQQ